MKSCAHWLNWKCGIAMGAAREKVRVAHALHDLPQISSALRAGRVSFSKVRAMTPIAARRADALERMADCFLARSLSGEEAVVSGGDRCTIHLRTDMNTLKIDGDGAESELASGGCVSAEMSRRLACDCGVVHWLEDSEGTALNIGRRTRSIPPAIRRALERRDGGCRFPGCTAQHYVDAHHVRHWADGGETRLNNLLLLCRHYHRLVHEVGYGLAVDAAGEPVCTAPSGMLIPSGPETRFLGNVFALTTGNRRERVEIGAGTGVPYWYGERMDDGMAVERLIRRE